MSDMAELQKVLDSVRREGSLIDRYIGALRHAGDHEGITRGEALDATRRFAELVEKSAASLGHEETE